MSVFSHPEFDSHLRVTHVNDPDSGLVAIHAIHRSIGGRSGGGIRFRPYATEGDALTDVLRLSRAMSNKFALAGIPVGGAKSVIIGDPATLKTPTLLAAFGRFIDGLQGLYIGGPDIGTNADDMVELARTTPYVAGRADQSGSTAVPTALGCFAGLQATVRAAFGRDEFHGLRIAIQGVGGVGGELARMLVDRGAEVLVADVDSAALRQMAPLGVRIIAPEAILSADVDILSPNAMGAVLSAQTVPTIRARAICGCANNQLATPEVAHLLTERGILWAPDYVVSAGGAIDGCKDAGILSAEERDARIAGIGTTLTTIFDLATRGNTTTEAAAQALARDAVENV